MPGLNRTLLPGVSWAEVIKTSHCLDRCDQKRPYLIITCHFWGRCDHSAAGPTYSGVFDGRRDGTLFLRSDGGNGVGPVAGRLNSSSYGPGPWGQARNVVEQVPSCRLRRHRSLLGAYPTSPFPPIRSGISAPPHLRLPVVSPVLAVFGNLAPLKDEVALERSLRLIGSSIWRFIGNSCVSFEDDFVY